MSNFENEDSIIKRIRIRIVLCHYFQTGDFIMKNSIRYDSVEYSLT